ncbi:hypothetical protein NDU88_006138 [Pleurodeles waltl]|uniref:Secreted protein n=1 Tax=Pleurodeles waltl TaxID=8319 RepID=A0AAV7TD35_PLEWA|nr:hypothetical protein NDU88_006138 [Pleurodeles waltl]
MLTRGWRMLTHLLFPACALGRWSAALLVFVKTATPGNIDEGCSRVMFMDNDDEVVRERGGMSLDGGVEQQHGDVGSERGDDPVPGDVGSERGDDPVLGKRSRKPPSLLKDFFR